ncbi:MAG: hypothetical protein ACC656_09930, partial [Candidatus Heimdallarchaeota archaeon]
SIIRYTGSKWINQNFEKTIPREINMIAEASVKDIDDWQILSNDTLTEQPSIIDTTVYVNNVKIGDIEPSVGYKWGTNVLVDASSSITNGTNTTFDVIGGGGTNSGPFYLGEVLGITSPSYGLVNVVEINGSTVTIGSDVGGTITGVSTATVTVYDNVLDAISTTGDYTTVHTYWNSNNVGYAIESDDDLTLNWSVIEN